MNSTFLNFCVVIGLTFFVFISSFFQGEIKSFIRYKLKKTKFDYKSAKKNKNTAIANKVKRHIELDLSQVYF